jgi:hypothetical protein
MSTECQCFTKHCVQPWEYSSLWAPETLTFSEVSRKWKGVRTDSKLSKCKNKDLSGDIQQG